MCRLAFPPKFYMQQSTIRLSFRNTKESKDINVFIKMLQSMDDYLSKESSVKFMYIYLNNYVVKVASKIQNILDPLRTQGVAIFQLKSNMYTLTGDIPNDGVIYQFDMHSISTFLNSKIQSKITDCSILFEDKQMHIKFETIDKAKGKMRIHSQRCINEWPNFTGLNIIPLFEIPASTCTLIQINDPIWMECQQTGIIFKKVKQQITTYQEKIDKDKLKNYDYLAIKKQLQMKTTISSGTKYFLSHLQKAGKMKDKCKLSLLLIMDLLEQDKIKSTYLIIESENQKLSTLKLIYVGLNVDFKPNPQKNIKDQALKRQQNTDGIKKAILNKYSNLDYQLKAADRQLEQQHNVIFGKIEQGDETITRKRKFEI